MIDALFRQRPVIIANLIGYAHNLRMALGKLLDFIGNVLMQCFVHFRQGWFQWKRNQFTAFDLIGNHIDLMNHTHDNQRTLLSQQFQKLLTVFDTDQILICFHCFVQFHGQDNGPLMQIQHFFKCITHFLITKIPLFFISHPILPLYRMIPLVIAIHSPFGGNILFIG